MLLPNRYSDTERWMVMGMELENRMISAEWLKAKCYEICEEYRTNHVYIDRIIDEIDNSPDVEVVRCKDCKWWKDCHCTNINGAMGVVENPNWFCAAGERKDNG